MHGLDSETVNGRAWLLCRAGSKPSTLFVGPVMCFSKIADWLIDTGDGLICFNLTYDAQAILLHTDQDTIWRLERLGEATFQGYSLEWIRGKRLTIEKGKRVASLYDCWQYFEAKLEDAAFEHLGIGKDKLPDSIDIKNLAPAFANPKLRVIVERYCMTDAQRCLGLWQLVERGLAQVGMVCTEPISGAYMAGKFFLSKSRNRKPPSPAIEGLASEAYYGGRSELVRRGIRLGPVFCCDIHSAYPAEAASLPDPKSLRANAGKNPSADATLGLYNLAVRVNENLRWGPLPVRTSPLTYPVGRYRAWVDRRTFEWLSTLRGVSFDVLECIEWLPTWRRPGRLMFPGLADLYKLRKDPSRKYAIKKLLNGLYGKLAQVDEFWVLTDNVAEATLEERGYYLKGLSEPGPYRNLLLASHITGGCRARLGRAMTACGEDLLMVATDSVWTCSKPKLDYGPELGQWDCVEHKGWLGIQTGVYCYHKLDPKTGDWSWRTMARGFGTRVDLLTVLQQAKPDATKIEVVSRVPLTALWALQNDRPINEIADFPRDLSLNGDSKRFWDGQATAGSLLKGLTSSFPPLYSEPNLKGGHT